MLCKLVSSCPVQVKLRGARRADARLAALNQVKQSMAAPDWELDDAEWCAVKFACRPTHWPLHRPGHQHPEVYSSRGCRTDPLHLGRRPTFRPSMKLHHQPPKTPEVAARRATLATYVNALADLAAPKKAMAILSDTARLEAFDTGIRTALQRKPGAQARQETS
jgi:hypothetical protein